MNKLRNFVATTSSCQKMVKEDFRKKNNSIGKKFAFTFKKGESIEKGIRKSKIKTYFSLLFSLIGNRLFRITAIIT